MIISLVGFRGSGKSSVGPLLASQFGYEFIDLDQQLEKEQNQTIPTIFEKHGEEHFRTLEAELLKRVYQRENLVVATGGGAVLNETSQKIVHSSGPVIWLQADAETTLGRIEKDRNDGAVRPSLTDLDFQQEVVSLLETREPIYRQVSHLHVDTATQTPEQISNDLLLQIASCSWEDK